jgi:hypothetical protein
MRYLIALLLGCSLFAQDENLASQKPEIARGAFYVDGIVYQYAAGRNYTVVAAAHSVINRKFVAIKVRVYNAGQHSITVKPEDVVVEDAIAGHTVTAVSGSELANKMRKPYNMARFGVSTIAGGDQETPITSDMVTPQMLEMMRAMAARANNGTMPSGKSVLYTDTPGALESGDGTPRRAECDQVCRLRIRENQGADPLTQLQRQTSPDSVEQFAFLANTIPPRADVVGVLYYPLGKLSGSALASNQRQEGTPGASDCACR